MIRYWELEVTRQGDTEVIALPDGKLPPACAIMRLVLAREMAPAQIVEYFVNPGASDSLDIRLDARGDLVGELNGVTVRARIVDVAPEIVTQ